MLSLTITLFVDHEPISSSLVVLPGTTALLFPLYLPGVDDLTLADGQAIAQAMAEDIRQERVRQGGERWWV